jgi:hypothetical protein
MSLHRKKPQMVRAWWRMKSDPEALPDWQQIPTGRAFNSVTRWHRAVSGRARN